MSLETFRDVWAEEEEATGEELSWKGCMCPQHRTHTLRLREEHLNECHPEPYAHRGCPICYEEDRVRN